MPAMHKNLRSFFGTKSLVHVGECPAELAHQASLTFSRERTLANAYPRPFRLVQLTHMLRNVYLFSHSVR